MASFQFIDNGKSFNINFNNIQYTAGKNDVELVIADASANNVLEIRSNSAQITDLKVYFPDDTITGVGAGSTTATELRDALEAIFFLDESGVGGGVLFEGITPPSDTSKLWFNTDQNFIYFNDGTDWVTEQMFSIVFNEQGSTPNNTFLKIGDTATSSTSIGFYMKYDFKVVDLHYVRAGSSASEGNFDMYNNSSNLNGNASTVVATFTTGSTSRGYVPVSSPLVLSAGSYTSLQWKGEATSNNLVSINYRIKYT